MGQVIAGPIVGTFLGDLGADVIKIGRLTEDVWRGHRCKLYGESFPPELSNCKKHHSVWVFVPTTDSLAFTME
jgi:crotonobetainyl-CoA:carnitine CoA-transferase CaiB-like acyl-CoA transferase